MSMVDNLTSLDIIEGKETVLDLINRERREKIKLEEWEVFWHETREEWIAEDQYGRWVCTGKDIKTLMAKLGV